MLNRTVVAFCLLAAVGCLASTDEWQNFVRLYGKRYANAREEQYRMSVFERNADFIRKHNAEASVGQHAYTLAVNQFADMTNSEFVKTMNGFKPDNEPNGSPDVPTFRASHSKTPSSVDWRDKGIVTPIKNQGSCGSCWAFSAVGGLEGQHAKKNGTLVSLSEQQLVDCSSANNGCNGGWVNKAFAYVKRNGGIDTERSYPYDGEDDSCSYDSDHIGATCTGYVQTESGDEDSLKEAAATVGPISVCIDASHQSFQFYDDGVYYEENCSSYDMDHCVLVVGYGTTSDNDDYWIVKNSWGTDWGQDGYIWMARNSNNNCGVASYAYYPTM